MSEPTTIPEWIATVVGRLVLENEAMRQALTQSPPPVEDSDQDAT